MAFSLFLTVVLIDFLPPVVGAEEYDRAVVHCLDCLRNPRLNRLVITTRFGREWML